MDRGAWWATVHGVAKSQTRLSAFTFTCYSHTGKTTIPLEKNSFASAQEKKKRRKFMGSYLFLNIQNKLGQCVTHAYVQFRTKLVIELGSD